MSINQEYLEVIEFLNLIKEDAIPHHEKTENEIPYEYYEKILRLTNDQIDFYIVENFLDYMDPIVNYVMDNLPCFNIFESSELDPLQFELHVFAWDVTDNPVIPYILGLTPKTYKACLEQIYGPNKRIFISLYFEDHFYENKEKWSMRILHT